jgi:hypothetical protein
VLQQVRGWLETGAKLFDRRGAPRIDMPPECFVIAEGGRYPLKNWSRSGFLAAPYDGELRENRSFTVRVAIRHEHYDFVVDARAVAVRRDAAGLAARFVSMAPASRQLIDDYFSHYALWVQVTR